MPFTAVVDIDGATHQYWQQSQTMGCGPSCIAMIAKKFAKSVDERWISELISSSERTATIANLAGQGHDFSNVGTFNVQAALRHLSINGTYTDKTGNFDRSIRRCTKSKPGMAWIQWQNWSQTPGGPVVWTDNPQGGTHWIVILGKSSTNPNRYIVLDPAAGHGISAQNFSDLPYYIAPTGSRAKFRTYGDNGFVTTT